MGGITMGRTGTAIRSDFDAGQLRVLARHGRDANQARRLLSLAAIYEGMARADAANVGGMDRQTLRDWVVRFNDEWIDGLLNRKSPGRRRRLSQEQLDKIVEAGPDLGKDGVVRRRAIDLKRVIEVRFGVSYGERHVMKLLNALGFSHISARPKHPKQDAGVMDTFKKTSIKS
jgi:transposase